MSKKTTKPTNEDIRPLSTEQINAVSGGNFFWFAVKSYAELVLWKAAYGIGG